MLAKLVKKTGEIGISISQIVYKTVLHEPIYYSPLELILINHQTVQCSMKYNGRPSAKS